MESFGVAFEKFSVITDCSAFNAEPLVTNDNDGHTEDSDAVAEEEEEEEKNNTSSMNTVGSDTEEYQVSGS